MELSSTAPRIIGICGKARHGKTTVANALMTRGYIERSFARSLKDIAGVFGFNSDQTDGDKKEELDDFWGVSCRQFLQRFGTEVGRDYLPTIFPEMQLTDESIWIKLMRRWISSRGPDEKIVISDVRFPDEMRFIKELGGIIIEVIRPGFMEVVVAHSSENSVDASMIDSIIMNSGSIYELYETVDSVISINPSN